MERHCTLISDSKNKTFKIYAKAVMMSRIKQIKNNFKLRWLLLHLSNKGQLLIKIS